MLLLAAAFASCTTGADAIPTFSLPITNDLPQTVIVKECSNGDSCITFTGAVRLRPGQSVALGQWTDGILRPLRITNASNKTIGCLPIKFDKQPPKDPHVSVSQAVPCGTAGGSNAVGNHDWPYSSD